MKLEKNDAWAVANEEIKTLQEIIQDANAKLQNQENELRREQDRGNELEQKIYEAQIKARFKKYLVFLNGWWQKFMDIFLLDEDFFRNWSIFSRWEYLRWFYNFKILKPVKLGEIEKTEEENKDQLNITSSHQHELENELKDTIQKVSE